jgi:hypothetical protein
MVEELSRSRQKSEDRAAREFMWFRATKTRSGKIGDGCCA